MKSTNDRLDGNAAAGTLQSIFPFDMTMAIVVCSGCRARAPIAELAMYPHGMGTIVRCADCDTVLIRVAYCRGHRWLEMRGVTSLSIADTD
jgi:LSD1 subclass zinc finger protein